MTRNTNYDCGDGLTCYAERAGEGRCKKIVEKPGQNLLLTENILQSPTNLRG